MNDSIFLKLGSLKEHDHLCHLYFNDAECFEIGANFIIHGIKNKEKCLYVSDKVLPKELAERLRGSEINVDKARREKDFEEIISGVYGEKIKDPNSLIGFFKQKIESHLKGKRKLLRILITNKDTSFSYSGTDLVWEKASLDKIRSEKPIALMSQYEIGRASSEDLIALLRTHPTVILEDLVYESPFYTRPDNILAKLQGESSRYGALTSKEKRILRYIVNGYSNKSIAKELSISVKTVETHRVHVMRKLDIHKLVDLVKFAMKNRIT